MATVEKTRPLVEYGSNSQSLNSSKGSGSVHTTKSSASELLSITDAAVKALEKTKGPTVHSYMDEMSSAVFEDGMRMYSPCEIRVVSPSNLHSPAPSNVSAGNDRLSVGRNSSTASEILIRGTDQPQFEQTSPHDVSNMSRASVKSSASSTFLTGEAKHVKLPSKKLKEIISPFNSFGDNSASSIKSSQSHKRTSLQGQKSTTQLPTKSMSDTRIDYTPQNTRDFLNSRKSILATGTITESGYATQSVPMGTGQETLSNTADLLDTSRGPLSATEEILPYDSEDVSHQTDSPIEVVAKNTRMLIPTGDITPEIITIPESAVYVNMSDMSRSDRGSVTSERTADHLQTTMHSDRGSVQTDRTAEQLQTTQSSTNSLGERFSKFHTSGLKQGTLGNVTTGNLGHKGEVHISRYGLDTKQKMAKQALSSRGQGITAVKKHVTPIVITNSETTTTAKRTATDAPGSTVNDVATTAAMAAASAVAATQPFLKAQQDLELRLTELMSRVSAPQTGQQTAGQDGQKLEDLERQLTDLTQRRLDYLEEMQKQQMQWQAQLLSVSRDPPNKQTSHPHPYRPHPQAIPHPAFPAEDRPFTRDSAPRREKSVLDTPAPRRKPPTPTTLDESSRSETRGLIRGHITPERKTGTGGLLAQILANDERYGRSPVTPNVTPIGTPVSSVGSARRAFEHSPSRTDLNVTQEYVDHKPVSKKHTPTKGYLKMPVYTGPAPLDMYLEKPSAPPTSPYPKLKDLIRSANAPVPSHYADASATLHKVALSRRYLEDNLDSVVQNRAAPEVYSLLEQIRQDSSVPERLRIQKMVDGLIQDMNTNMEREVMDELLRVEENKKATANFLIPERDTTVTSATQRAKVTGPGQKVTTKVKGRAESRIDTGLRRDRRGTEAVAEKENVPLKKIKKTKASRLLESKNRPFSKTTTTTTQREPTSTLPTQRTTRSNMVAAQRTTQKEPYLRFQSTSPKARSPKALTKQAVEVKGVVMSSAKTQAGSGYVPPQPMATHGPATSTNAAYTRTSPTMHPVPPTMVPMAIPLGAPRKDGGLTAPITFPSGPQTPGPLTSTPMDLQGPRVGNVAVMDFKDPEMERQEEEWRAKRRKAGKLEVQTLPSVDIDTVLSDPSSAQRSKVISSPKNTVNFDLKIVRAEEESNEEAQESSDDEATITEADSSAIDIPGYTAEPVPYHGPLFPPQAPPLKQAPPTSEELAIDLRRRDILQNQAQDWVEQELMARMLSEYYTNLRDAVSHTPNMVATVTRGDEDQYTDTDTSEEMSGHDTLIAQGLGQDGLQLFVNAGQPVNDALVSALFREVVEEKIRAVIGSRGSHDDMEPRAVTGATPKASPRRQKQVVMETTPKIPTSPVETPKATPRHTPPPSPGQGTPPATPDYTPPVSLATHAKVAMVTEPVTIVTDAVTMATPAEDEDSVRTDSEEERLRFSKILKGVQQSTPLGDTPQRLAYEVMTPDLTPPRSPLPGVAGYMRTPSLSEATPPPVEVVLAPEVVSDVEEGVRDVSAGDDRPIAYSVAVQAAPSPPPEPAPKAPSPLPHPTSPPLPSPDLRERPLSASTAPDEDDTTSLSMSTISDTNNEQISEGQWLVTLCSEGEIPQIDNDLKERIKQRLLVSSQATRDDDTYHSTDDIDQEASELPPSEGEFHHLAPGHMIQDAASLYAMMSQVAKDAPWATAGPPWTATGPPQWPLPQPMALGESAAGVDRSLGEISFGPVYGAVGASLGKKTGNGGAARRSRSRSMLEDHHALGGINEYDESDSPPRPTVNNRSPSQTTPGASKPSQGATGGSVNLAGSGNLSQGAAGGTSPQVSGPVRSQGRPLMSTMQPGGRSLLGSGGRRSKPGTGRSLTLSQSLNSDQLTATSLDQTSDGGQIRLSQTSLHPSDLDTQTTDRMNVEALLASRDYYLRTQSDLGSTLGGTDDIDGQRYRLGTMGSTSDMSLAPGLTQTLERSEEEVAQHNRLSYTAESDTSDLLADLRAGGRRTATTTDAAPRTTTGPSALQGATGPSALQMSVTLPSMAGEEESVTQEDDYDDVSELSLGAV